MERLTDRINNDQWIEIAKAGFPPRVSQFIDFNKVYILRTSEVLWLYRSESQYTKRWPPHRQKYLLSLEFSDYKEQDCPYVQFITPIFAFNQLRATKKMQELGIIS